MHVDDKMMAGNVAKTVMILIGFMFAIILLANLIA